MNPLQKLLSALQGKKDDTRPMAKLAHQLPLVPALQKLQPKQHIGANRMYEDGSFSGNAQQLAQQNPNLRFYEDGSFGQRSQRLPMAYPSPLMQPFNQNMKRSPMPGYEAAARRYEQNPFSSEFVGENAIDPKYFGYPEENPYRIQN